MTGPVTRAPHRETVGDLAIVLHSHMPYVEGFGTYPFGEEWLFEAVARSHIPVLEVAENLTMTVTPVLADQLEAAGVKERMLAFLRRHRLDKAERDAAEAEGALRNAARAEADQYAAAIAALEQTDAPAVRFFQDAPERGVELIGSAATHAVMPMLATRPGRRLQLDAGLRSHRRRFGPPAGVWLPECAFVPGLDELLAERSLSYTCLDQSGAEPDGAALAPIRLPAGPVAFTIDWPSVALVWSDGGYPSDPAYMEYHRLSLNGTRLWSIGGDPYDPERARDRAAEHAEDFLVRTRARLDGFATERSKRGLCVFAIDTELLGHWWAEGPHWLASVLRGAGEQNIRLVSLSRALADHEPERRQAHPASWGEGKTLETWDSPRVSDLAWAARRLELRLLRALATGEAAGDSALRAARELLAAQASDWAFMDNRGQAGDYPYRRVVTHAEAMLEAIDSPEASEPGVRNLAPDLSLAPLLEP